MTRTRHLAAVAPEPVQCPARVVIANGHDLMRVALRRLLEESADVEVLTDAGDLALTARDVAAHRPDVLVLGLNMPDGSSLELIRELADRAPATRVVVVSIEDALGFAQRALASGAWGYVLAEHADVELQDAVRAATEGRRYLSASVAERLAG